MSKKYLKVNLVTRSHGTLDVHDSNVLPLLLQQGCQKVSSKLSVNNNLLPLKLHVSNGNVQAHDLLHLELNGGLDLIDLLLHIITAGKKSGEFTRLGKTRSQKTRDLLDQVIGSNEEVIPLGKLLDQLLVLVEFLEVLDGHVVDSNTIRLFAMSGVSEDAALEVRAWDGWEFEGSGETLLTLRVVVFECDLKLNGFGEVAFLSLEFFSSLGDGFTVGVVEDVVDGLFEEGGVKLSRHCFLEKVLFGGMDFRVMKGRMGIFCRIRRKKGVLLVVVYLSY